MIAVNLNEAANIIRQGGVIAYPTESCFGLGCDPTNIAAVSRVLKIKRRPRSKGLIIIADHYSKLRKYVESIPPHTRDEIFSSWPGPHTWLLPARKNVSTWIRGEHDSIAVRVTGHHQARTLCRAAGIAIVSTSANYSGRVAHRSFSLLALTMGAEVDGILQGRIGTGRSQSDIRDSKTGIYIRSLQ